MYSEENQFRRVPKAPFERRAYAFLIDFIIVWIFSSLVTNIFLELVIFVLLWFIFRVIIVQINKGQSLGRWAMDLKIADIRRKRQPSMVSMSKREGVIALIAFTAMIGLKINFKDSLLMVLLLTPIIVDGLTIFSDDEYNQAFHDRLCDTIIIQTRRGFSLDLRLKKLFKEAKETWQKKRKK
ncbi:RDD family protein [Cyanobacterium aponinum UTEX 3222]|uniref:RDD domain containing protein n=2 Tax=Cyanobacterium aponinum TaxID=379064 RepID=K9Z3V5_CYAAP|nr:RDD family protein [Cyanobacterium aponinum]WRL41036.1 RDD family protein [Cyanobacterium aponinum UTEX 3222]AFZ53063.1 RDD domain containing protein [Cyanobacterium aponinum PCC 10605]PHV61212.1 hypothetical protein CSQ80_16815 [Cyanobacterium aponinum IPPAS B-1201]WPF90215.1 RDD family protein [Cyanobacterium aponinum AL20115]WRL38677.1 RDD family protein [Cyanobacterium aponinum UTEX 3221]